MGFALAEENVMVGRANDLEKAAAGVSGFEYWAALPNPWSNAITEAPPAK